jgi:serine/threonine protein phosphatase PrpC
MATRPAAFGLSDVGRKREQNEDSFAIDEALGLYVVADGMGGHAHGEVASRTAVDVVREYVAARRDVLAALAQDSSQENRAAAQALIAGAIQLACGEIFRKARAEAGKRGMGTTCDAVIAAGSAVVIGHVGDSRVYLVRHGRAHRLTEDHTLVAMQIKAGLLTPAEAAQSSWRSVLIHAVGVQESVPVDTLFVECQPGDRLLLCSDGLHNYLGDDEVGALFAADPTSLPQKLIDLANERGGEDNITAVVVSFADAAESSRAADAGAMMELLQRIPMFSGLTYKEQAQVLSVAGAQKCPEGHVIVREGTVGDTMYIVVAGKLSVEKDGIQIGTLGPGGHFGEMVLIDDGPRSATVFALEPARVLSISRAPLMRVMRREPRLAVKLLWSFVQTLSDRLRLANLEIVEAQKELAETRADQPYIVVDD